MTVTITATSDFFDSFSMLSSFELDNCLVFVFKIKKGLICGYCAYGDGSGDFFSTIKLSVALLGIINPRRPK